MMEDRPYYHPEDHGALCNLCVLRRMRGLDLPVGPEVHEGAQIALISEAPGETESKYGRPLCGKAGMEEMNAVEAMGLKRGDFHWTQALACRPPKNRLERALVRVRAKNKVIREDNDRIREMNRERRKQGMAPADLKMLVPTPLECCRPRLMKELKDTGITNIIALGKASLQGLDSSHRKGILGVRGMPVHMLWSEATDPNGYKYPCLVRPLERNPENWPEEYKDKQHVKVLPTVAPGFVMRAARWRGAFHNDHQRALKLFDGTWVWQPPKMEFNPTLSRVRDYLGLTWVGPRPDLEGSPGYAGGWLATGRESRAFDYETDLLETLDCVVRCIQIGTPKEVIVIAFRSVERVAPPYSIGEHDILKDMLRAWFTGQAIKFSHNGGYYDALVTEAFLGVQIRSGADNILAHRLIAGELPHSLGFLGSTYSLIHDWKSGDPGVNARTDLELWTYGAYDSSVTAEIATPLYTDVIGKGLGGFAQDGNDSRLLKEVKEGDGRPRRGSNWTWTSDARGIPVLEIARVDGTRVQYAPGIATPQTPGDLQALKQNNSPILHEGLTGLLALDHSIQDAGRDMHLIGMLPNQQMRVNFFTEHAAKMEGTKTRLQEIAHRISGIERWGGTKKKPTAFNPASPMQVRKLLSEHWKLDWEDVTATTGVLSVGDGAVRKLLSRPIPDEVRHWLIDLRAYRKAHKIVTTYLIPLGLRNPEEGRQRPSLQWGRAWSGNDAIIEDVERAEAYNWADLDDESDDLEALDLDALRQAHYAPPGRSKLRWNGRVHADWKAHMAVTGRISSSPNLQNIIRWLRAMFVPSSLEWLQFVQGEMLHHPGEFNAWASRHVDLRHWKPREGHTFVYADADQIELRIAASRWGAARYLEAFDKGWDPHQITMHAIWGDRIWQMQGAPPTKSDRYFKTFADGSEFDKARDLGKGVLYASVYGAKVPTVHDIITGAEDRKGNLIYRDLTLREVRMMQTNLLKNCPEFPLGWQREIHTLKTVGYIQEPVTGRRFDCLDGSDDLSLIVNRPIQSSGAGIIALATAEMRAKYPAGFGGPFTGLVNHCHDAMTWEVPISMAKQVQRDLTDAMCRTIPAFPDVAFVGEAILTPKWK
ncbi:MAG TPA: hypothetical protein EYF98_07410 [Planctomycetes bacterium]|nr:hypothetical protein [Planctomycetota bacterium]